MFGAKAALKVVYFGWICGVNIDFEIYNVFFASLFIPGDLAEIICGGQLGGYLPDRVDEFPHAVGGLQRVYLFSKELKFPNLCSFCEGGLLVEDGEKDGEGERCFGGPALLCHHLILDLVVLSIDEKVEHFI